MRKSDTARVRRAQKRADSKFAAARRKAEAKVRAAMAGSIRATRSSASFAASISTPSDRSISPNIVRNSRSRPASLPSFSQRSFAVMAALRD